MNARVMLTVNIDLKKTVVNGQLVIMHIVWNSKCNSKTYSKFDGTGAGVKAMNADIFGEQNSWLLIEKIEADITIKLSKISS